MSKTMRENIRPKEMSKHRSRHERSRSRERDRNSYKRRRKSPTPERLRQDRTSRRHRDDQDRRRNDRPQHRNDRDDGNNHHRRIKTENVTIKTEPESPQQENAAAPREMPNFGLSGTLAEDTNVYNGVIIKYNEPLEARKPKRRWRLYPFKGEEQLPVIPIHRQSAYLMGRERRVADIPIDHPSCSKQHAALQYRLVHYERDDGTTGRRVRPYIIDLESANGTYVNNNKIEPKRYVELIEKDVIKFGYSSREYVVLHEESKEDEEEEDDDNVNEEPTEDKTDDKSGETAD